MYVKDEFTMKRWIEKYAAFLKRHIRTKFVAFNVLIAIALLFVLTMSLFSIAAYRQPTDLKQKTGVVCKFHHYDKKWYDDIFGYSTGPYFSVRFEDASYFEATGICYENIDRTLFEGIKVGEEITITYFEKIGGPRKICAIEYKGESYLSLDDVLIEFSRSENVVHTVASSAVVISISVAVVLFIINYKRNRAKYIS